MTTPGPSRTHVPNFSSRSNSVSVGIPTPVEANRPFHPSSEGITFTQFPNPDQVTPSQNGGGFQSFGSDIGGLPTQYCTNDQVPQAMNIQQTVQNGLIYPFNGLFCTPDTQQPPQDLLPGLPSQARLLNDAMNNPMSFGRSTFNASHINNVRLRSNFASTQSEAAFNSAPLYNPQYRGTTVQNLPESMSLNQQVRYVQRPTEGRDTRRLTHDQASSHVFDEIHRKMIRVTLTRKDETQVLTTAKGALDFEETFITRGLAERLGLEVQQIAKKKHRQYLTPIGLKMPCGFVSFKIEWTVGGVVYHTPAAIMVLDITGDPTFIHLGLKLVVKAYEKAYGKACRKTWQNRHSTPRSIGGINNNSRRRGELPRAGQTAHSEANLNVDPYSRAPGTSRLATAAPARVQHSPSNAQAPLNHTNTVSNQFLVPPNTVPRSRNTSFSATQTFLSPVSSAGFTAPLLSSAATAITSQSQMEGPSMAPEIVIDPCFGDDNTIAPRKLELNQSSHQDSSTSLDNSPWPSPWSR
ncbi:hypothetical protein F5B20DRAFT_580770 [Whalleya microplaca]|nr:hypothetical protein F5B20DRAFT_580770 [Whalleya microplaca]